MKLKPFLLDQWLNEHEFADPPVEFNLASSTGPIWTLRELTQSLGEDFGERLLETHLVYGEAAGGHALRQAIGRMAGVSPDSVVVTTGASEALWILFLLASEGGANVLAPLPCFPTMNEAPRALGLELRHYRLRREDGFRIDLDEIEKLTDSRTRLILVNSPHNPTGATLSDEELARLHDFTAERGISLVMDEVYHPIYHGRETASAARLPRATVLGSFSKAFSLSALRIGWMIEPDPRQRETYVNARSYLTISSSAVCEALAVAAIGARERIFSRASRVASENLARLESFFRERAERFDWVKPRGGLTAFPWLRNETDARPLCRAAARAGVLLAPGDCFDMPAHFRLGFAASGERFSSALERLADVVAR